MESNIVQDSTSPDNRLLLLCGAFDDELRQHINDSGDYSSLDTEENFLLQMKDLPIKKICRSAHLINPYRMIYIYVFMFQKH